MVWIISTLKEQSRSLSWEPAAVLRQALSVTLTFVTLTLTYQQHWLQPFAAAATEKKKMLLKQWWRPRNTSGRAAGRGKIELLSSAQPLRPSSFPMWLKNAQ